MASRDEIETDLTLEIDGSAVTTERFQRGVVAFFGILNEVSRSVRGGKGRLERIARARSAGGRVIAVGTTVLRALESSLDNEGKIKPGYRYTSLFITPGYKVKSADLLFTNFHLPRSTLFILVCALAGVSRLKKAYKLAIEKNTDFFLMVTHV